VIACTITHITAETVRYGGGMLLRFYAEDEEHRKWKTSIKVNHRHVTKTNVFVTLPPSPKNPPFYAYKSATKLIPKSKFQNLTYSMSFVTLVILVTCMSAEQKKKLLKAKIAVALHDELGRVPTKKEIDQVFFLTRVMYKAVLGLHFKRKEQKKTGQLTIS